jgi:hypothetical protein
VSDFPHTPEAVTGEWLSARVGAPVTSFSMEQIGVGVGLLGRLYRITLTGDATTPATVVAKFPTLDEGARMNVTSPLGFYSNEVNFYTEGAPRTPIATAQVYDASFDDVTGDFVLLMEDVASRRCVDQTVGCGVADAQIAIDALAGMHAHWWNSDFAELPWLKRYTVPPYPQVIAGMFKQAWPVALDIVGAHLPAPIRAFGDRFPDLAGWFLSEASEPPVTLCHGDYRLDNLFFGVAEADAPVTVLDWQICFRGNPGYDLGYFISQSLATDTRRDCQDALIERYVGALASRDIAMDRSVLDAQVAKTFAYCFIYPIAACGQIEATSPRMVELVQGMTDRAVAAIEDVGALALLPD